MIYLCLPSTYRTMLGTLLKNHRLRLYPGKVRSNCRAISSKDTHRAFVDQSYWWVELGIFAAFKSKCGKQDALTSEPS